MSNHPNTITLNGKLYDALTGALVGQGHKSKSNTHKTAAKVLKPTKAVSPHRTPHSAKQAHRKPQHAKTLMRHVVRKPGAKHAAKVTDFHASTPASHTIDITGQPVVSPASKDRLKRAATIPKNHLVSRFSSFTQPVPTLVKKTAVLKVKPAPEQPISHHKMAALPETPAADNLLSEALSRATSHTQTAPKHHKKRKFGVSARAINIGAGLVAMVILGGFIFYQNATNISMRVAASRAGVNAVLPGYKPSGFSMDRAIQSNKGQVTVKFHSNSDQRSFNITQANSDWNSDTLVASFVAESKQPYQKITQNNGKTIYLYGDSNATWVDGGIWYRVEGNSSLSSAQLLNIADSF